MSAPQARTLVHQDITPSSRPELASHYLDVPNMPWEPTKFPGIRIKVLYSDDSGITTALFRLDPGAVVPLHEHTALEQTYVLEGTLAGPRGRRRPRPVRVAAGRQPARGGGAERRRAARLLPQAEPVRLRGEVLHRGAGEVAPSLRRNVPLFKSTASSSAPSPPQAGSERYAPCLSARWPPPFRSWSGTKRSRPS